MVHSVTPEDDVKILDKKQNAKRFAYCSKKSSSNPWQKFQNDMDGELLTNLKPLESKLNRPKKDFDLENVWSIRNNVSIAEHKGIFGQNKPLAKPGTYSRHKALVTPGSPAVSSGGGSSSRKYSMERKFPSEKRASFRPGLSVDLQDQKTQSKKW